MTLKKDALVAVSLAGVVLIMASASTNSTRLNPASSLKSAASDMRLLGAYQLYLAAPVGPPDARREKLQPILEAVRGMLEEGRIKAPADKLRAATILCSSTEKRDLDAAYSLSVEAFEGGMGAAEKIIREAEDRILLSIGSAQRHGTQTEWKGLPLWRQAKPARDADEPTDWPDATAPRVAPAQG